MKLFKTLFVAFATVFFLGSCSSDNETNTSATSQVQFKLVDAPGDYEEVNVEIVGIVYKYDTDDQDDESGWRTFTSFNGPINVDLTTLVAGNNIILADEVIEAGYLSEVRLILSDNNTLLLEGENSLRNLDTPSAQQSGLKLKINQELEGGFTYSFILDWDVQNSIVETGSGKYNLKPVIRATAEASSGSANGFVFDGKGTADTSDDEPVEDALVSIFSSNGTLVATTLTNDEGMFMFQGLSSGDYTITVVKDNFIDFSSTTSFNVTVGTTAQVDNVVLNLI